MTRTQYQFHIIGIGNPIMGDDGIGLAMLEQLQHQHYTHPDVAITFIDGGTSGMELLPAFQDADWVIVLDALAGPGDPGSVHSFVGDQLPRLMHAKLSPHQVGLLDLLSVSRLLGQEPTRIAAVGVVAEDVSLGVGLTKTAAAAIPQAVQEADSLIRAWLTDVDPLNEKL